MSTDVEERGIMSQRTARIAIRTVLVLWICTLLGCIAMVIGAYLNDRTINAAQGRALGRITAVTAIRTSVEFQDATGILRTPRNGLLYPTGLAEGQRVWVTYALTDPDLVKVEGRTWRLAFLPAGSSLAVGTVIAAGSLLALQRWKNRA